MGWSRCRCGALLTLSTGAHGLSGVFQPEDQLRKARLLVDPTLMVDKAAGPIEADCPLIGLEHLDEDGVVEQPCMLDESAAVALSLMVRMRKSPPIKSSMIDMKATISHPPPPPRFRRLGAIGLDFPFHASPVTLG